MITTATEDSMNERNAPIEELDVATPSSLSSGTSAATSLSSPRPAVDREAFLSRLLGNVRPVVTRPTVLGIHHLKFAVSNLDVSIAWYERVLGASRIAELDHFDSNGARFAAVCKMVDWAGLLLELRKNGRASQQQRDWDTLTLFVHSRDDIETWTRWLDRWATSHSPILVGVRGWILVFEDPDGRRIRLYTRESHNNTLTPSMNSNWLGEG